MCRKWESRRSIVGHSGSDRSCPTSLWRWERRDIANMLPWPAQEDPGWLWEPVRWERRHNRLTCDQRCLVESQFLPGFLIIFREIGWCCRHFHGCLQMLMLIDWERCILVWAAHGKNDVYTWIGIVLRTFWKASFLLSILSCIYDSSCVMFRETELFGALEVWAYFISLIRRQNEPRRTKLCKVFSQSESWNDVVVLASEG